MRTIVKTVAATVGLLALITTAGCGPSDDELRSKAADACVEFGNSSDEALNLTSGDKAVGATSVKKASDDTFRVELKVKGGDDGKMYPHGAACIATWKDGKMHPKNPFN